VKGIWVVVFGLLVAIFAAVFAIAIYATVHDENKQAADVAARQAECKKLVQHVIEISPQHAHQTVDVPIEDIEQCGAAYPEVVACMEKAPDVAGVKACIPQHVDCKGPETVVEGAHAIFEVTGDCKKLVLKTSNAFVIVKSPQEPTVQDTGTGNRVENVR
jgi:hypothetical protein